MANNAILCLRRRNYCPSARTGSGRRRHITWHFTHIYDLNFETWPNVVFRYSSIVVRHPVIIVLVVFLFVVLCGLAVVLFDFPPPSFDSLQGFEARGTVLGEFL